MNSQIYIDTVSGETLYVDSQDGPICYYIDADRSTLHRVDGPALISKKCEIYYNHSKAHKVDGPAKVWNNGYVEYWIDGVCICTGRDTTMEFPRKYVEALKEYRLKAFR